MADDLYSMMFISTSNSLLVGVLRMRRIIKNAIKCIHCGDIIESRHRHDFVTCSCGCCCVDGGTDYLRRGFVHSRDDFIELSEFDDASPDEQ
jgi:hypothetical protein